ncbi:TPA: peptide ABC transporter substrate-binding protein [Candidatus Nomurabacteria bacterium]|nr:MAG: Extracellular solute-binding protein family 5 [Parcubacteria bacterium RAAC4_OD1_1]HCY26382.1 peptide ABC transporter substrate-binding protein [Candidatus Nomurabacteria bacterium]
MHNLISFLKEFKFYKKDEILESIASFKKRELLLFISIFIVTFTSFVLLISKINNTFSIEVPTDGGSVTEGIIGMTNLVNPVLATSDADKDLTLLVYSGLMRKSIDGTLIPDLAEEYPTISTDGKTYTFKIRGDAKFHNGVEVKSDDIIFTIEKIKDSSIKSPKKIIWDNINIKKIDEKTIEFILPEPYIYFLDNTTLGILPSSLWKKVNSSEFGISPLNIKAVGSGPYKIKSVKKDNDGIPEKYELESFNNFTLGKPHIKYLTIISYANEKDLIKALNSGSIDQANGISANNIKNINENDFNITTATLSRLFGLFFNNTDNKILEDTSVIKAINLSLDRNIIIEQVLGGYGTPINNPVPESIVNYNDNILSNKIEAVSLLEKAGWTLREDGFRAKGGDVVTTQTKKVNGKTIKQEVKTNTPLTNLVISITTGDTPELRTTAILVKEQLEQIGIKVEIKKVFETGQLNQIIRDRDYEVLLFGQVVNNESDLYSFWHSSQKNDPGLNIAMYNNKKVDTLLESVQNILSFEQRLPKYEDLYKEFNLNIPAVFIYSPKYLYITSKKLNNVSLDTIRTQSDRFLSIYEWYADKDNVWKVFEK